jgi:hypothetical protein
MNDRSDGSGSNTGLVVAIVVLLMAVPCCGGLALVGAALLGFSALDRPGPPPVMVQPAPAQPPPVAVSPAQPEPPPVLVPGVIGSEESVPAEPLN